MLARTLVNARVGSNLHIISNVSLALQVSRRAGHNVKAPGVPHKIYHPHVLEPERTHKIKGNTKGPATYIPSNYRHQQYIESLRTGEHLGADAPYNFLGGTFWKERRYNATYHPLPHDVSIMPGIMFIPKFYMWSIEWYEQGIQRFRWFRCQQGFMKAKYAAETFRTRLIEAGRVDNRRTERQIRMQQISAMEKWSLRKRKFRFKDARRLGNSGTTLGPQRRVRDDYKRRGLLP